MENYKQKNLPDAFKAISLTKGWEYACKRTSKDTYNVRWPAQGGGFHFTEYTEQEIRSIIFYDSWKIVEEPESALARILREACLLEGVPEIAKPVVSGTLESIKKFCSTYPAVDVIISSKGYHVVYNNYCDEVFAETDEQLQRVFDALAVVLGKPSN